jgi:hypothetical protein
MPEQFDDSHGVTSASQPRKNYNGRHAPEPPLRQDHILWDKSSHDRSHLFENRIAGSVRAHWQRPASVKNISDTALSFQWALEPPEPSAGSTTECLGLFERSAVARRRVLVIFLTTTKLTTFAAGYPFPEMAPGMIWTRAFVHFFGRRIIIMADPVACSVSRHVLNLPDIPADILQPASRVSNRCRLSTDCSAK